MSTTTVTYHAKGVSFTELGATKVREFLDAQGADTATAGLRVGVRGGGCSGFQYKFDITRERAEDDVVIAEHGATVVIDPVSLEYMSGSHIDFVDDLIGASFKIENPHASSSCGCGTSFALAL